MDNTSLRSSQIDSGQLYKQLFNNVHIGVLVVDENPALSG